jgi:hypothetical protein
MSSSWRGEMSQKEIHTLESEDCTLPRNVRIWLPPDPASNPRIREPPLTLLRKPFNFNITWSLRLSSKPALLFALVSSKIVLLSAQLPNPTENSDYLRSGTGVFPCPHHLLQQFGHWPSAVNTIQSDNFKPEPDVSTQQLCEQLMLHVFVHGNVSVMYTLLMVVLTSSRELQVLCVVCSIVGLVNCSVN